MKKIIAGIIWMLVGVNAMSAQTEVTPDMIWREGVTFVREFTVVRVIAEDLDIYNEVILDTVVYNLEYILKPVTVDGVIYFVDYSGRFDNSYRREENEKIYGFVFNDQWAGGEYAESGEVKEESCDARDGSMGKECFMHDFNTWAEGDSVEWIYPCYVKSEWDSQLKGYLYKHDYRIIKEKINKLEKLESPDGKYWMGAYQTDSGEWRVKGLGEIDYSSMNFNEPYGIDILALSLTWKIWIKLYEVRSPEGEVYFRYPEYNQKNDDDLGAIATVAQDNGVSISGNAGEVCVTAAIPTDVEIFTAQGVKVYGASAVKYTTCKLQQGLYIVRAGSHVKKLILN